MTKRPVIRFRKSAEFEVSVERLWDFHMSPGALSSLSPPLSGFRVIDPGEGVANGSVVRAEVGLWPFKRRWVALHSGVERYRSFTDLALESPFPFWVHVHDFESVGSCRSRLTDSVWFLPPPFVGRFLGRVLIRPFLGAMFAWRHRITKRAVESTPGRGADLGNPAALFSQAAGGGAT